MNVKVKIPKRDNLGKVTKGYTTITGTCTFLGYNDILEWWQVTVDRTPVVISSPDDVEFI